MVPGKPTTGRIPGVAARAGLLGRGADRLDVHDGAALGVGGIEVDRRPDRPVVVVGGVVEDLADGPAAGLVLVDAILSRGELVNYHLAHAARADLCRRLGRTAEACASYEKALSLTQQEPERRFLKGRLSELAD